MARGKKKEELSLEEKLERALVPVKEQPYEVPENWCWTTVESISDIVSKGTTPKGGKSSYVEDGIRFLRVENFLDDGTISHEGMMHIAEDIHLGFLKRSILIKDDVLISIAGTLGKTAIVQEDNLPINTNQAVAFIRLNSKVKILPKYLRFSLVNPIIQKYLLEKTKVTSIPNLTLEIISGCPIPLPPLSEQQRIVERVESLFAKLDEAKEKVQVVVDGYEARNASIYHKAFCGKLTEKWRVDNNIKNEWKKLRFDEVADIKSNLVDPLKYLNYPHIAPDNIEKRTGKLLDFHTIKEDGVVSGKHRFHAGQILYSKIRPYLSKVVMVDFDGLCSADMYPIEARGNTRFLWYYMLSDEFLEQASSAGSRSVLPKINQKELSAIEVSITSEEEQAAVVDMLDSILPTIQQAKEAADNVIEQIDFIKQSILAKAFRGELGTNNPAEESSVELLKNILEETGADTDVKF